MTAGSAPGTWEWWKTATCGCSAGSTEVVISGGHNVYPAEVEDVLLGYPDVVEVAVSGTPSDEWGEVVTAWVVPASAKLDVEALLAARRSGLAPYKRPRIVRHGGDVSRATRWARCSAGCSVESVQTASVDFATVRIAFGNGRGDGSHELRCAGTWRVCGHEVVSVAAGRGLAGSRACGRRGGRGR